MPSVFISYMILNAEHCKDNRINDSYTQWAYRFLLHAYERRNIYNLLSPTSSPNRFSLRIIHAPTPNNTRATRFLRIMLGRIPPVYTFDGVDFTRLRRVAWLPHVRAETCRYFARNKGLICCITEC